MRITQRQSASPRGFTLIELISTMAVVGALGSIAASILIASIGSLMQTTTAAQLHTELSIALDRVDRELRNIPLDSGASDIAPNIDSVTSSSIAWGGSSQLSFASGNLYLTLNGGSAVTILQNVISLSVKAYDEDNAQMASSLSGTGCDGIRRLQVDIRVTRDGVTEDLRTKIYLRSTMAGG